VFFKFYHMKDTTQVGCFSNFIISFSFSRSAVKCFSNFITRRIQHKLGVFQILSPEGYKTSWVD